MADTPITAHSLDIALLSFGRRLAVVSGALVALVALLVDAPVWVASARGALTLVAMLLTLRFVRALLTSSLAERVLEPGPTDADSPVGGGGVQ